MKYLLFIMTMGSFLLMHAQSEKLLGICSRDEFMREPHSTWFIPSYTNYKPEETAVAHLKKSLKSDVTFNIFFATWCNDSKRELPRYLRILDEMGVRQDRVELIGVDSGKAHKQAPGGENIGKHLYRVATFIVYRKGVEIGRIVEHPVVSLERDLLSILNGAGYTPNYLSFPIVSEWIDNRIFADPNVSISGMGKFLRPMLNSPSELNSVGRVLQTQGRIEEGLVAYRINNYIFYDKVDSYLGLAYGLKAAGKYEEGLKLLKNLVTWNDEEDRWQEILDLYYEFRNSLDSK
jgi:tetratricopeptide (TPR) repeat protein